MGNFSACFCLRTQTAKLLDLDGGIIRKVKLPVKAAELMLENPGYVVSPVDEIQKTRRMSPLRADDELLGGKIYLLAALGRIHSKVSMSELKNIELACKKNKVKQNGSRVLPAVAEETREEKQGEIKASDTRITGSQLGCCHGNKRWNPNLESISEDFSLSFREREKI